MLPRLALLFLLSNASAAKVISSTRRHCRDHVFAVPYRYHRRDCAIVTATVSSVHLRKNGRRRSAAFRSCKQADADRVSDGNHPLGDAVPAPSGTTKTVTLQQRRIDRTTLYWNVIDTNNAKRLRTTELNDRQTSWLTGCTAATTQWTTQLLRLSTTWPSGDELNVTSVTTQDATQPTLFSSHTLIDVFLGNFGFVLTNTDYREL